MRRGIRAFLGVAVAALVMAGCGDDDPAPVPPTISLNPTTLAPSCTEGTDAASGTFEVRNSGGGTLSYTITVNETWLSCGPSSGTSTGEDDTITVTYTTSGLAAGTHTATITVTDAAATNSPQTVGVTLTVNPLPPQVTTHPTDQTVTEGQTATFTVTATGSGTLLYQWKKDGVNVTGGTGGTTASYTTPATVLADSGAQFACVVTNAGGSVTSNAATLTVNMAPPQITVHPSNQAVTEGQTATFTVTATGSGTLLYQWKKDGVNVTGGTGGTTASYTTPATVLADSGAQFTCVVSNSGGSVTSNVATLTVNPPHPRFDFNGDGFGDVIVGAIYGDNGGTDSGCAFVFLGSASPPAVIDASAADVKLVGGDAGDCFGFSVSSGDVNADGFGDVIVGAYGDDDGGSESGCAFVFFGSASPPAVIDASAADVKLVGGDADDLFGYSVSGGGP